MRIPSGSVSASAKIRDDLGTVLLVGIKMIEGQASRPRPNVFVPFPTRRDCTWSLLMIGDSATNSCESIAKYMDEWPARDDREAEASVNGILYRAHPRYESCMGDMVYIVKISRDQRSPQS
jgi:hypothetical protein